MTEIPSNILDSLRVQEITKSLEKFLKYANHLAIEFIRNPSLPEGNTRGTNHVQEIIEACYKNKLLSLEKRNYFYSGELPIEEIVFRLLEILILEGYFFAEDYGNGDSSNPISFSYAWDIYTRLGNSLKKERIEIPSLYIDSGMPSRKKNKKLTQEQREIEEHIDKVLAEKEEENDKNFDDYTEIDEYPFLSLLQKGITILENLEDLGGELYDFDCFDLLTQAERLNIIDYETAQDFNDRLERDSRGQKAQIIFQIFQIFYESNFIDSLDIAEDDKNIHKKELSKHFYALHILASTGAFT